MVIPNSATTRAVIFAPHGRDATIARTLLEKAGIRSIVCANPLEFESSLDEDACFALVTEEALRLADLHGIRTRLSAQPAWSDLPFIILTQRTSTPTSEPSSDATALYEIASNVTLLERPFRPATFVSVARTAFKGRRRQFEARNLIEELHEGEERLRTALLAGHLGTWELDLTDWTLIASAGCKALFGRDSNDPFSYEDLLNNVHDDDREHIRETVRITVEKGVDCAVEFRKEMTLHDAIRHALATRHDAALDALSVGDWIAVLVVEESLLQSRGGQSPAAMLRGRVLSRDSLRNSPLTR